MAITPRSRALVCTLLATGLVTPVVHQTLETGKVERNDVVDSPYEEAQ